MRTDALFSDLRIKENIKILNVNEKIKMQFENKLIK